MADVVQSYIYDEDIRLKIAILKNSIDEMMRSQNLPEGDKALLFPAALFAALYSTEQKDDSGSVYVSLKYPGIKTSYTSICETKGLIRGYKEHFTPTGVKEDEILLIVGIRLAARGDYQSAVVADNIENAAKNFYKNSCQTHALVQFFNIEQNRAFAVAEYLPGHNVNYQTEDKKPTEEMIYKKLQTVIDLAEKLTGQEAGHPEKLKQMPDFSITFGCTCSKRKIKNALFAEQEALEFPIEISCKFCGKKYTIEAPDEFAQTE